ncbi:carbonic anhydrase [Thermanaerovibrio acidaminovorans DSM 6589]|uniref:Carbonic anhydrase n=1 Tax=Thermanaerovibrio acidaminovorans (strain ATCC 49978 / DSM 6589 / Su883) TaxID=525903 RepID=D1B9I4_THEAS|nr:acetyltransferase [Thermanaerovibrio acidaminovorans]ACZ18937.1 carbonic anhydrase [Thermanaerovibrio acidaminovorans DSM 6589]
MSYGIDPAEPLISRGAVILCAGGHGAVLYDLIRCLGVSVLGVVDRDSRIREAFDGVPVLGGDPVLEELSPQEVWLVNGLGANPDCAPRNALYRMARGMGFEFPPLVHPSAVLARDVRLSQGCQVMAGAVIQTGAVIGENSVVNTRASLDHHCVVGFGAFISPGAVLCGGVRVGDGAFVGAGSVLLPGVSVGDGAVVGAGSTVVEPIPAGTVAIGSPARVRR